ncbi:MAG: hypothetical protein ACFFFT_00035 [Candidatus Thorarchaeota archaeon]
METFNTTKIITDDLRIAGYKTALNKRNTLGLPQFHTQGVGNSVPDIFFWDPRYEELIFSDSYVPNNSFQIRAGFIETKSGDHLKELIEGVLQNVRYYGYFISNKAKVTVKERLISNIDCFLVGTKWSRTGMIYKRDEFIIPEPIPFISEAYNVLIPPYTAMFHGLVRYFQQLKREELRSLKLNIDPHKLKVQTGIMFCKIPYDENLSISDEYYAWIGNKMKVLSTNPNLTDQFIETQVYVHKIVEEAVLVETKINEKLWIPKDQINNYMGLIEDDEYHRIKISRHFYKRKEKHFGII